MNHKELKRRESNEDEAWHNPYQGVVYHSKYGGKQD